MHLNYSNNKVLFYPIYAPYLVGIPRRWLVTKNRLATMVTAVGTRSISSKLKEDIIYHTSSYVK